MSHDWHAGKRKQTGFTMRSNVCKSEKEKTRRTQMESFLIRKLLWARPLGLREWDRRWSWRAKFISPSAHYNTSLTLVLLHTLLLKVPSPSCWYPFTSGSGAVGPLGQVLLRRNMSSHRLCIIKRGLLFFFFIHFENPVQEFQANPSNGTTAYCFCRPHKCFFFFLRGKTHTFMVDNVLCCLFFFVFLL